MGANSKDLKSITAAFPSAEAPDDESSNSKTSATKASTKEASKGANEAVPSVDQDPCSEMAYMCAHKGECGTTSAECTDENTALDPESAAAPDKETKFVADCGTHTSPKYWCEHKQECQVSGPAWEQYGQELLKSSTD